MNKTILAVMLLSIVLVACGSSTDVATVNGKKITKEQYDAYLKFKRIAPSDDKKGERHLSHYLEREALTDIIEKEEYLGQESMKAELAEFKKEMYISRYFDKFLKDKVTEQAVKNYYTSHAKDYEKKKVHVAHILIRANSKMSKPERQAKLTTAMEAYSKIVTGEDFGKIAGLYSEDKVSSKKGGDLGWLKQGSISPTFSEKAFELKQGDVSKPLETPFGFHVIKVIEEPKSIKRPFEAVAGNIRYQLRNEVKKAEMDRLMGKAKIKRKEKKE